MKFKIDENLPSEYAEELRSAGYDAETAGSEALCGADDNSLLEHCKRENRVLMTLDLDFSNVQVYPPGSHPGVIVLRPHRQDKYNLITILRRLIPVIATKSVDSQLWIVEADRVRIREQ